MMLFTELPDTVPGYNGRVIRDIGAVTRFARVRQTKNIPVVKDVEPVRRTFLCRGLPCRYRDRSAYVRCPSSPAAIPTASCLENAHGAGLAQLSPDVILDQYGLLRELGDDERIFSAHKRCFMLIVEVARPSAITVAIGTLK